MRTSGFRRLLSLPARPVANFPGSDRRSIIRLDRWQEPPTCAGCPALPIDLSANLPTCAGVLPPARLATTSDSHLALILQLGWLNDLRLSPAAMSQLSACAVCCCNLQLALAVALCQTGGELRLASAVHPPASPASTPYGLRRMTFLPPAGPLMHPLLQPNLASPAEPSMSIPYPPVRAPSGSAS